MSKDTKADWYCPSCKSEGNTGSFCATCGKAMPAEASNPVVKVLLIIIHIVSSLILFAGSLPVMMAGTLGLIVTVISGEIDDFGYGRIALNIIFSLLLATMSILPVIFGIKTFKDRKKIAPGKYTLKEIRNTAMYVITIILIFVFAAADTALAYGGDVGTVAFMYVIAVLSIIFLIPTVVLLMIDAANKPKAK